MSPGALLDQHSLYSGARHAGLAYATHWRLRSMGSRLTLCSSNDFFRQQLAALRRCPWTIAADHRINSTWSILCLLTTQRYGAVGMGIVIPFAEFKRAKLPASAQLLPAASNIEGATADAIRGAVNQLGVLAAARPLLDRCRDRFGFVVMRDGLPQEPAILGRALLQLFRGLSMLDAEMAAPRTYPTYGVYFGRRHLAWFEDGYSGTTALAVPNGTEAAELAAFVRPRIAVARSRSHQ